MCRAVSKRNQASGSMSYVPVESHRQNLILPAFLVGDEGFIINKPYFFRMMYHQPEMLNQDLVFRFLLRVSTQTWKAHRRVLGYLVFNCSTLIKLIQPNPKPWNTKTGIHHESHHQHKLLPVGPRIQRCSYQVGYSKISKVLSGASESPVLKTLEYAQFQQLAELTISCTVYAHIQCRSPSVNNIMVWVVYLHLCSC